MRTPSKRLSVTVSNTMPLSSHLLTIDWVDFDLSWAGATIYETRGCNNQLGAVRFLDVPTKQGVYEWHEELVKQQTRGDGSVFFEYQLKNSTYPSLQVPHSLQLT
jgi:hypothetical protein